MTKLVFLIKSKIGNEQEALPKYIVDAAEKMTVEEAYKHPDKLGAGAKKRKKLKNKQDKVHVVMGEFKRKKLRSGSGDKVTNRKQAIAIALSEAGLTKKSKPNVIIGFLKSLTDLKKKVNLVFFKNIMSHKYLRKEGDKYIYEEAKGDQPKAKQEPKRIEGLEFKDGFYWDGKTKITNDYEKAKQYAEKKTTQKKDGEQKPEIKIGAKVRIKPDAKSKEGIHQHQGRGLVATIKEIKDGIVKLVDEAGKEFVVKQHALEMAKSIKLGFFNLIKNITGIMKSGHKYIRRQGGKGNYRYWYRDESGKIVEGITKEGKSYTLRTGINIGNISAEQINTLKEDRATRANFIVENQKYITAVIQRNKNLLMDYETGKIDVEDAYQNGNLGMIHAIRNFNLKKYPPNTFSTYLYTYIKGYMKHGEIKDPKTGEYVGIQGVDRDNILDKRFEKILNTPALDENVESDIDKIDLISKEYKTNEQYEQEQKERTKNVKDFLSKIKSELKTKNEKKVVDLLTKKQTGKEIATAIKISPVMVHKILKKIKEIGSKYSEMIKSDQPINAIMEKIDILIKSIGTQIVFFKSKINHKYIKKIGEGKNAKYIYEETDKKENETLENIEKMISIKKFEKMKIEEMYDYANKNFKVSIQNNITPENKKAWCNIMYQLELLKDLGFANHTNLSISFQKDYAQISYNKVARAFYSPSNKSITIGSKFKNSFVHEYFHHLFYTERVLGYKDGNPIWNQDRVLFVKEVKKTKSYQKFLSSSNSKYYADDSEMVARFGNQLLHDVLLKNKKTEVRVTDAPTGSLSDFTKSDLEKLKDIFMRAFKQEMQKSLVFKSTSDKELVLGKQITKKRWDTEDKVKKGIIKDQQYYDKLLQCIEKGE